MAKAVVRCQERLSALKEFEAEQDVIEKQIQHAKQQQKIEEADAPGLLTRLLNRKKVQTYQTSLRNTQQHLLTLSASLIHKTQLISEQRKQLNEADAQKRRLQQEIDRIALQREEIEQKLRGLKDKFSGIALPDSHKPIDNAGLQRTAGKTLRSTANAHCCLWLRWIFIKPGFTRQWGALIALEKCSCSA